MHGRQSPAYGASSLRARYRDPRGGLRPPALVGAPFARRRNYDFYDAQTHMHRSGGVSPPCVALTHLQWRFGNCRKTVVGALADAVAMALPQPLLRRSALNGNRIVFRIAGSRTTGGLRPPRSCSRACLPTELRLLRCTNAHAPGAAGVSPPCVVASAIAGRYRDRAGNYRGCADEGRCMYVINSHSCGGRR